MDMELQIGVAKINKYASSESGDTIEFIERPGGGISVVMADGQMSGKSAKAISNKVVRKVISLLAEGVRDGAAARAASDYLFHEKRGKVQATLNILSVDLASRTLVISRNNPAPVIVFTSDAVVYHDEESKPVGIYRNTRPVITEIPLEVGLRVYTFTDGVTNAGVRTGNQLSVLETVKLIDQNDSNTAQAAADNLLFKALVTDNNRPVDDISIVVLMVLPSIGDGVRRANIRLPIT